MLQKLLIISHVLPFPGSAGQELRVRYMLRTAAEFFDVDFLTCAPRGKKDEVRIQLAKEGCRPLVLESNQGGSDLRTLIQKLDSGWFVIRTGLKSSNYRVGVLEFSPERVAAAVNPSNYDCVIYEYFHAVDSARIFKDAGVPVVLDMHNILWRALEQRFAEHNRVPACFDRMRLRRYRQREEAVWREFDALIAINRQEHETVFQKLLPDQRLFYCPMGVDLGLWHKCWQPADPPRLAFYGGLGSRHNEAAALRCHDHVMPLVWQRFPKAELWLVGSNPSEHLRQLTRDRRVKVTGFVEAVQDVLKTMSLALCPWSGTYGFRSRIVEVMALGVPIVASSAAVDGMELKSACGIILTESDQAMAESALKLLSVPDDLRLQSHLARSEMERLYGLDNTYGRLMSELHEWLEQRTKSEKLLTIGH